MVPMDREWFAFASNTVQYSVSYFWKFEIENLESTYWLMAFHFLLEDWLFFLFFFEGTKVDEALDNYQPYFLSKSLVLFLERVKTITTQARIQGGKFPVILSFFIHPCESRERNVIKMVIIATPKMILVTGLIRESWSKEMNIWS